MTMYYTAKEDRYLEEKRVGAMYHPVYRMCSDGNYREENAAAEFEKGRAELRRQYGAY